jgi:thioredoxin 2
MNWCNMLVFRSSRMSRRHRGPARAAPEIAQTASDMAGREIVVRERYPELAMRYNVRGIPNFVVSFGGHLVTRQAGVVDHSRMEIG